MKKIILIGAGGHSKVVIDSIRSAEEFDIVGLLDLPDKIGTSVNHVKIIGTEQDLDKLLSQGVTHAFITVGSIGATSLREQLAQQVQQIGFKLPIIIDPSATISPSVAIGEGTYIAKGALINADTTIGKNVIINTGAIIEHDCLIGDFTHIAPGSVLSGSVQVEDSAHIGTGSTIIQGIHVGQGAVIGAGSVVVKNIEENVLAYGNPCRKVRNIHE